MREVVTGMAFLGRHHSTGVTLSKVCLSLLFFKVLQVSSTECQAPRHHLPQCFAPHHTVLHPHLPLQSLPPLLFLHLHPLLVHYRSGHLWFQMVLVIPFIGGMDSRPSVTV